MSYLATFALPEDSRLTGSELCQFIADKVGDIFGYELDGSRVRFQTITSTRRLVWADSLYLGFVMDRVMHVEPKYNGEALTDSGPNCTVDCAEFGCSGEHGWTHA